MDLWIRSQDKTFLMKIDNINLGIGVDSNKPCRLFTFVGGVVTSFTLGTYKSEERALEVLDEIQEILKPKTIIKFNEKEVYDEKENMVISTLLPYETFDIKQLSTYVYQMPKE